MFGVTSLPVLWSPAGVPIAGVPGPRRSADERDAGWFAPVATRRRFMLGGLQPPSPTARSAPKTARRSMLGGLQPPSPTARSAPKTARRSMLGGLRLNRLAPFPGSAPHTAFGFRKEQLRCRGGGQARLCPPLSRQPEQSSPVFWTNRRAFPRRVGRPGRDRTVSYGRAGFPVGPLRWSLARDMGCCGLADGYDWQCPLPQVIRSC
jgi:hypothetical protein